MVELALQFLALAIVCFLLFRLWRASLTGDRLADTVITAGFLIRAVAGQAVFWVSYLGLPFARPLQRGDGLWFFAIDGIVYAGQASAAADLGISGILQIPKGSASISYVQTLASTMLLLGRAMATAVLLNLFCYLGSCFFIGRWGRSISSRATLVALLAIAFSPGSVLWCLQPLKDTFFQFAVVTFVAGCAAWQRAWTVDARTRTAVIAAALMVAALYVISGMRWYFAFAALLSTTAFIVLTGFVAKGRRLVVAGAALVLLVAMSRTFLAGAGPYVPQSIRDSLRLATAWAAAPRAPGALIRDVEDVRRGYESTGGATSIALSPADNGEERVPAVRPDPSGVQEPSTVNSVPSSTAGAIEAAGPSGAAERAAPLQEPASAQAPSPTPAPSPLSPISPDISGSAAPAQAPGDATRRNDDVRPDSLMPTSPAARFTAGAAALFVPRSIGQRLGLFTIGGGKGLMWFAEVDTLFFDLICFLTLLYVIRHFRNASLTNPVFWLVVLVTALVAVPLAYTVTNFGTLFRLRQIILVGIALTPLALMSSPRPDTGVSAAPEPGAPRAAAVHVPE